MNLLYESRKLMAKHCYENAYKSKQLIKSSQKHTEQDILEPTGRFDQAIVFVCLLISETGLICFDIRVYFSVFMGLFN